MDSHGGWIARTQDQVRFALAVDGTRAPHCCVPRRNQDGVNAPAALGGSERIPHVARYGWLGWNTVPVDGGYEWSHAGALEGSNSSWLVRKPDGTTLAFAFNCLPENYGGFFQEVRPAMHAQVAATKIWPDIDLFDEHSGDQAGRQEFAPFKFRSEGSRPVGTRRRPLQGQLEGVELAKHHLDRALLDS